MTQTGLDFKPHGGAREGAGRKPTGKAGVAHRKRESIPKKTPVHVTIRTAKHVGNLRTKRRFTTVRAALRDGAERFGANLVHFSVQRDHLHLIIEPCDRRALMRMMKGLQVRLARRLNKLLGTKGTVFKDRYHVHVLRSPREVRNAVAYVIQNARRHAAKTGKTLPKLWIDPYSSARWFEGFRGLRRPIGERVLGAPPGGWLLAVGWRTHGLIRIDEVPG